MLENLIQEARRHGDRLAAISVSRLPDVKADFDHFGIDTSPYYHFSGREGLGFETRSVLVAASSSAFAAVSFFDGIEKRTVTIPPTYVDGHEREAFVRQYLMSAAQAGGFHIASADRLPCKAIAARAGLGTYGRNNIIYVDGMGSFLNLFLFFSDIPCDDENFFPLQWMRTCRDCRLCVGNCPTAALTYESDLVDADRCLTMLNESSGDFPEWIEPEWHHALIGCTACQTICPRNKPYASRGKEIASFDREQTEIFLNGTPPEDMLAPLGLTPYAKSVSRNLRVLLDQ